MGGPLGKAQGVFTGVILSSVLFYTREWRRKVGPARASTDPQLEPCRLCFYLVGSSVTWSRKVSGSGNPDYLTGSLSTQASAGGEKFILTGCVCVCVCAKS